MLAPQPSFATPALSARSRAYMVVDVFTQLLLRGNPVAVVLEAEGLSDAQMQAYARWTQLSETTFVLPPSDAARAAGADYQLRIFTPSGELDFAGHPTLGSCHAWLAHGGIPYSTEQVVQECKKGLVSITASAQGALYFEAPNLEQHAADIDTLPALLRALGLKPDEVLASRALNNGSPWLALLLDSPERLLSIEPDWATLKTLGAKLGLAALYESEDTEAPLIARSSREARAFAKQAMHASPDQLPPPQLEVRALVGATTSEDPVTGSLNAALAQWLSGEGWLQLPYMASQGSCVGRDGQVLAQADAQGRIWIGGHTVTGVSGRVLL